MTTVLIEEGCIIIIYTHDHPPPHVHVKVGNGIVILLLNPDVEVREAHRVSASDIQKARVVVKRWRSKLRRAWKKLHKFPKP